MKYILKLSDSNRKEYPDIVSALTHGYGLSDFVVLNHKGFFFYFHCDEEYLAKFIYHYVPQDFDFDDIIDMSFVLDTCYDRYYFSQCEHVLTRKEFEKLKKMLRENMD